ncbi:MAG: hypothetical protein HC924_17155, partial [Synechococcaceae cyanobacterium SM2_3_2]|nr:hypothetical protein [Synechococcaceae cyanobacterium SM2_3_2]
MMGMMAARSVNGERSTSPKKPYPNRSGWPRLKPSSLAPGQKSSTRGDVACYSPAADRINLPNFSAFTSPEAYYATALHEHHPLDQGT